MLLAQYLSRIAASVLATGERRLPESFPPLQ
jgi:hypothetical protein